MNLRECRESIPMQVWEFALRVVADDKTIRNAETGDRISAAIAREMHECCPRSWDARSAGRTSTTCMYACSRIEPVVHLL